MPNLADVHLLLNHIPTVGFGVAVVLVAAGVWRRSDDLLRTGLALVFAIAVMTIATYTSGNAAEAVLGGVEPAQRSYPAGIDAQSIRAHEDAALPAFMMMELTGFFAWLALWRSRHSDRSRGLAGGVLKIVLALSVLTFAAMARTAYLGGSIHHPEIRAEEGAPPADPDAGRVRRFGTDFVDNRAWVWPTLETLHFVGLCMLFTVVLIVNLRLLGMAKSLSYADVYRLLPLGVLGFGVNLITGTMFYVGQTQQYDHNVMFYWKVVLIVLAGINALYFVLDEKLWTIGAGDDAPLVPKLAAVSAIVLWAGVLFGGHMLPFIGNSF